MKRALAVAAVLAALILPSCGDSESTAPGGGNTLAGPAPIAVPAPTPAPGANLPPSLVISVKPDPTDGYPPLTVSVNMCGSTDPEGDALQYRFKFGGGVDYTTTRCKGAQTYVDPGRYEAFWCVTDGQAGHDRCFHEWVVVH